MIHVVTCETKIQNPDDRSGSTESIADTVLAGQLFLLSRRDVAIVGQTNLALILTLTYCPLKYQNNGRCQYP